jgi:hypothetical protein
MATTLRTLLIATAAIALTTAGFVAVNEAQANEATRPRRDAGALDALVELPSAGSIEIQAKPSQKAKLVQRPNQTPAPVTTPKPTAKPTPKPTATPTPRPTRAPVRATPPPTARPTAGQVAKATPRPTSTPLVGVIVPPSQGTVAGAALTSRSALGPSGGVPLAPFLLLPGLMALLVVVAIARRRRPEALAVAPAASLEGVATTQPDDLTRVVTSNAVPAGEADVPRWRRPSVVAARFETDNTVILRAATADVATERHAPSVFTDWSPDAGERMRLRYDAVPLLDRPDDVLARTQIELDAGDEVLVLERGEVWANVTTPAGVVGWVPSMVLVEVSETAEEDAPMDIVNDAAPVQPEADPPSLEMLLEAAAARRRAQEERLQAIHPAQDQPPEPATARPRAKRTKSPDAPSRSRPRASNGTPSRARGT